MAKKYTGPQMVLANYLDDGRAVFFGRDGLWHAEPDLAVVALDEEALEPIMKQALLSSAANKVIDPIAIPAIEKDGHYGPAHIKHIMQTKGPSVRPDLGYQVSPDWEQTKET